MSLLRWLCVDFTEIYIADSESSSIRALNLKTGGSRLLAGGDPVFSDNLFKVIRTMFSESSSYLAELGCFH